MREPVLLASERVEDGELACAQFDCIPIDRPLLLHHILQRAPEEVFDLVFLAFLRLDADEQCAVDHQLSPLPGSRECAPTLPLSLPGPAPALADSARWAAESGARRRSAQRCRRRYGAPQALRGPRCPTAVPSMCRTRNKLRD